MNARIIRIGNSRGIRIPREVLEHYRIQEGSPLEIEERRDGILIRPLKPMEGKLSWEEAYKELAQEGMEKQEWAEWDALAGDGPHD